MNNIKHPLIIDLDGTLIKTDLLFETASRFLIAHPLNFFKIIIWLFQGKYSLKSNLAKRISVDVTSLPYNTDLLAWLRMEKAQGRLIFLATASHRILAEQVAMYLDLFDGVLATDNNINLKGNAKSDALVNLFGKGGFDYVGNDWPDFPIWQVADKAHLVSSSSKLISKVQNLANFGLLISDGKPAVSEALLKSMRPHQWIKNLLVFIPLLASHHYMQMHSVVQALLAFVLFSFTASAVYILNDLVDVYSDRQHIKKSNRPFASGNLSIHIGWMTWPLLLIFAFILSITSDLLPWSFTSCMLIYFILTLAYSLRLKQAAIVDVMTLAVLYTLRIIAGALAIGVPLSFWLLLFSMFIFLSLAFIKRYSELHNARLAGKNDTLHGRGYETKDLELVSILGGCSGYMSVLVLALYIQDSNTARFYSSPTFIWLTCPLLLFWISRAWLIAYRGNMNDDPIVFALNDRLSWIIIALLCILFLLAKLIK